MSRYLLTPTLYNSWKFYTATDPDKEPQKREEFLATLERRGFEPTPAILKGRAFEDEVRAQSEGRIESKSPVVQELGQIVKGGIWQQKLSKEIVIGDRKVLLYGIADVIVTDTINDIKRTANYAEGKYIDSLQHLIYMYCAELPKFRYLVAYGSGEAPRDWAAEDYYLTPNTLKQIQSKLADFFFWLEQTGWIDIYKKNWKCKES